jgi:hypothetical protein
VIERAKVLPLLRSLLLEIVFGAANAERSSATKFAIAAEASAEADAHALPDDPALYIGAERVDPTDGFMAGHPRPIDWKLTLHGSDVRMAYAASLDVYPYLA